MTLVCIWGRAHFSCATIGHTGLQCPQSPVGWEDSLCCLSSGGDQMRAAMLAFLWKLPSTEEEETVQGHDLVSRGSMVLITGSCRDTKDQMFGPLVLNGDNSEGLSQPHCLLENCLRPCEDQILPLPNSASFSSLTGDYLKCTP